VVFFDPPFPKTREAGSRSALMREISGAAGLLEPDGLIVWRLERRNHHPDELPEELAEVDRREYGRSLLVFAAARPAPETGTETEAEESP
jgi:16S rRNA G966 N2-methylase RsmD